MFNTIFICPIQESFITFIKPKEKVMKYGYYLLKNPVMDNSPIIQQLTRAKAEVIYCDLDNIEKLYPNKKLLFEDIKADDTVIICELNHLFNTPNELHFLTKKLQKKLIHFISLKENLNSKRRTLDLYDIIEVFINFSKKSQSGNTNKGIERQNY